MASRAANQLRGRVASAFFLAFFVFSIFRDGIDARSLTTFGAAIVLTGAFLLIETSLRRPILNYARLGVFSAAFGLMLVAIPATANRDLTFGAITWLGVTLLGLIWVIYYERTEPR